MKYTPNNTAHTDTHTAVSCILYVNKQRVNEQKTTMTILCWFTTPSRCSIKKFINVFLVVCLVRSFFALNQFASRSCRMCVSHSFVCSFFRLFTCKCLLTTVTFPCRVWITILFIFLLVTFFPSHVYVADAAVLFGILLFCWWFVTRF